MLVSVRVWHSRRVPQPRKTAAGTDGAGTVVLREQRTLARCGHGSAARAIDDLADGNAAGRRFRAGSRLCRGAAQPSRWLAADAGRSSGCLG